MTCGNMRYVIRINIFGLQFPPIISKSVRYGKYTTHWLKTKESRQHPILCHYLPAGETLFEWHFAGGPIVARLYMLTGKWAGNGLSNGFIKWFDPLIYAAVHSSLSWSRSATFDACFKLLIRMLLIAKTLILESRNIRS